MKTIWFDSTFGRPWLIALSPVLGMRKGRQPFIRHIHEVSLPAANDDIWTDMINGDERIVNSSDQVQKKPRLPAECKTRNITHNIFSLTTHN